MDGDTQPSSQEGSPPNSLQGSPVKENCKDNINSHNNECTKTKKRPFRDISTGFTKAVIICNSTELTRSESNSYRPNNIVIELLKKNPMRYGKVTFQKFTSEKEIRDELILRFQVLQNRIFWFASADQYGKLNFREPEEWSGRNVRRWLPGSSAMYIILETCSRDDIDNEERTNPELSRDTTTSSPYSGISCTTVRLGTSTSNPISCRSHNSQRALLDFLSSSEKSKLCNTQRLKMLAIDAGHKESKPAPPSKSPAGIDLRTLVALTKNKRVNTDLEFDGSRRRHCYPSGESLCDESAAKFLPKRKRTLISSSSTISSSGIDTINKIYDSNLEKEQQASENKKEKKPLDVIQNSHKTEEKISSILYGNFQPKDIKTSDELFIPKDSDFAVLRDQSRPNECLESLDERKGSLSTVTSHESVQRTTNSNGSKVLRCFNPYGCVMMSNPREVLGNNNPSYSRTVPEKINQSNGHEVLSPQAGVSPLHVQTIYVPSIGVIPWGLNQENAMHVPEKGPGLAFEPYSTNDYLKHQCEIFPCSGPCEGGQSFVVLFNQPLEDCFKRASFLAKFNGVSVVELTRVDDSTLKGKAIPESRESGHVTVGIEANGYLLGVAFYTYENSFIDGLSKVIFSGSLGGPLLRFIISSEKERSKMQNDLTDVLELIVYLAAQKGSTSVIDKILDSEYGDSVKAQCLRKKSAPHPVVCKSRHSKLCQYLENRLNRKDSENIQYIKKKCLSAGQDEAVAYNDLDQDSMSPSDSNDNTHGQDCTESHEYNCELQEEDVPMDLSTDFKGKADNLLLLSSIASRMENSAANDDKSKTSSSNTSRKTSGRTTTGAIKSSKKEKSCSERNVKDSRRSRGGFLKKVFVLPSNSLYLPSQSELCKLRGTISSYSKVLFNAEMSEEDVYDKIRKAFDDLVDIPKVNKSRNDSYSVKDISTFESVDLYDYREQKPSKQLSSEGLHCNPSFQLAVVDQTGKLVFYDGIWTGKVIRRKLRGNSVLYVVPVDED